jgi:hypothetical protein
MINAAVVGLGRWGQNILKNLLNSAVIQRAQRASTSSMWVVTLIGSMAPCLCRVGHRNWMFSQFLRK